MKLGALRRLIDGIFMEHGNTIAAELDVTVRAVSEDEDGNEHLFIGTIDKFETAHACGDGELYVAADCSDEDEDQLAEHDTNVALACISCGSFMIADGRCRVCTPKKQAAPASVGHHNFARATPITLRTTCDCGHTLPNHMAEMAPKRIVYTHNCSCGRRWTWVHEEKNWAELT